MKIQESGENYLETILILQERTGKVHSVDIAREMNFSKPSVCRAVSVLRKAGHLTMAEDGQITLTSSGKKIADNIYARHRFLTNFLISIDVTPEVAAADACRIEHDISEETFARLREHFSQK
jgi:DtxR family Mn-dependent transcriptional regulator